MSDITFEPDDTTFDDFMNSLPDLPTTELKVDLSDFDTLVAEMAQGDPADIDLDATQPALAPQELADWLDERDAFSPDMDL